MNLVACRTIFLNRIYKKVFCTMHSTLSDRDLSDGRIISGFSQMPLLLGLFLICTLLSASGTSTRACARADVYWISMRNIQFFRIAGAMIPTRVVPPPPRQVVNGMKKLFALEFFKAALGEEFNEIGIEQYCFWCKLYTFIDSTESWFTNQANREGIIILNWVGID